MDDCLFCKIVAKEIPCHKVYEDEEFLCFLDVNPVSPGHSLVISKKHFANLLETEDKIIQQMMPLVKDLAKKIKSALKCDGVNIISNNGKEAGQIIFHTHIHIIPRFKDDGLKSFPNRQANQQDLEQTLTQIKQFI